MKTLPPPYHLSIDGPNSGTLSRPDTPTVSLNLTWDGDRLIIESANGTVGSAALLRRILALLRFAQGWSTPTLEAVALEAERRRARTEEAT